MEERLELYDLCEPVDETGTLRFFQLLSKKTDMFKDKQFLIEKAFENAIDHFLEEEGKQWMWEPVGMLEVEDKGNVVWVGFIIHGTEGYRKDVNRYLCFTIPK